MNSRLKDIPRRIFLDSSVLQTLQTYGGFLYESEPLSPRDRIYRDPKGVAKLKALRWIMQVAERAPDPFRTHGCASWCKSAVYGLNGHRLYYIISLFKVPYKSTIQVSRNFHALFTKTLENSDTCD